MDGILNVYKPQGITSFSAVSRIRKFTGEKRVGHAGTLDPMATGVLPVLVGRAAALQEMLSDHDKSYRAGIKLGIVTDTGDITGNAVQSKEVSGVSEQMFENALQGFVGKIMQTPPMYSAIKINGERLYDLARKGVEVERKPRQIEIYSASLVERLSEDEFVFDVSCSKGTYIRTLCEDIGEKLGIGACMSSLERTVCGNFSVTDSVSLDKVEQMYKNGDRDGIQSLLVPAEKLFENSKKITLPPFYSRLCSNGCEIYLSKLGLPDSALTDSLFRVYTSDNAFLGLAEIKDFPDGRAIKVRYRLG